jgi:rubrerythrin
MKTEIKAIANQLDVYRLALKKEEESINLYQRNLSEATDEDTKRLFEYLIKQEKDHYAVIDQLVLLITHSEEWVEAAEFGLREEY